MYVCGGSRKNDVLRVVHEQKDKKEKANVRQRILIEKFDDVLNHTFFGIKQGHVDGKFQRI